MEARMWRIPHGRETQLDRGEEGRKRSGDRGRKRSRPCSSLALPEVDSRACHGRRIEHTRERAIRICGACT